MAQHYPNLADLTPVRLGNLVKVLAEDEREQFLTQADTLGLGAYRDADDGYWFGLTSVDISNHDRWLYHVKQLDTMAASGWQLVEPEAADADAPTMKVMANEAMNDDLYMAQETNLTRQRNGLAEMPVPAMMAFTQMLDTWNDEILGGIAPVGSLAELHDLVHHFEAWQDEHPEYHGMTQELVLRMHGLGHYLDVKARPDEDDF